MDTHYLCPASALVERGAAVAFDVLVDGQPCRAFAIRFEGQAHAYLNRCGHVPMEMDYVEGQFFDGSGQWLMCATHGATYAPGSGDCVAGPCRRGLLKMEVSEIAREVHWHTSHHIQSTDAPHERHPGKPA